MDVIDHHQTDLNLQRFGYLANPNWNLELSVFFSHWRLGFSGKERVTKMLTLQNLGFSL